MKKEEIIELVRELLIQYHEDEWKCVEDYRKDFDLHWKPLWNQYVSEMQEAVTLVANHAIGVQNVYDELQKIKTLLAVTQIDDETIAKIKKLVDFVKEI